LVVQRRREQRSSAQTGKIDYGGENVQA